MNRYFFDMDGTLTEWRAGANPKELYRPGYFRSLAPQKNVCAAARLMQAIGKATYVLSAFLPDSKYALAEKNEWLDMHLPQIPRDNRIFVPVGASKAEAVGEVTQNDVLLDDYTVNLQAWAAYGKGIKLINPHNGAGKKWTGLRVSFDAPPDRIANALLLL